MSGIYNDEQQRRLVSENTGLVVFIAKSLRPPNATEFEEYVQLGTIGLWKAIVKHEPKKSKLSTMAWSYIRWEIIRYINKREKYNKLMRNPDAIYRTQLIEAERSSDMKASEFLELIPSTLSPYEYSAVDMRNQGYTFQEIGDELGGYTRGWANKLFKSAVEKIRDAN